MKKRKIAIITPYYLPAELSGAEFANKQIAEFLTDNEYDVTIITSDSNRVRYWRDLILNNRIPNTIARKHNQTIIRLRHNHWKAAILYLLVKHLRSFFSKGIIDKLDYISYGPQINKNALFKILKETNFDYIYCAPMPYRLINEVIECTSQLSNNPVTIIRPEYKKKYSPYRNPLLKLTFNKADKIHTVSSEESQNIQEVFNINPKKLFTLPHTLKFSQMYQVDSLKVDVFNFKKKYKITDKKIILFAGYKTPDKGAIKLLKTVRNIHKKYKKIILIAIGDSTKEWLLQIGLSNNSFLLDFPYISGINKEILFAACDIFCLPSITETFGFVYLEAWHKKKPIIAADTPIMREIVIKNNGGLCVNYNDDHDLEKAITFLVNNQQIANQYGINGYYALKNKYSFDRKKNEYLELFK